MDLVAEKRQEDLPGAAELAEPGEDQPAHLLDPEVGIEVETDLAMPEIADRHADAQLAQARLGAGGIEHARRARRHPHTGDRIEHARGHDRHHARRRFDVNNIAVGAPLGILAANPPAMERVPALADLNVLPDMGRMTTRLRYRAGRVRRRCSAALLKGMMLIDAAVRAGRRPVRG